jgi:lipopolysaccharide export system protein LptA
LKNILAISFLLINYFGLSQVTTPAANSDTSSVEILNANLGEFILFKKEMVRKIKGNVKLKHNGAIMYCDSAILDNLNNVFAKGKVIIVQGDSVKIFADSVVYQGLIRIADLYGNVVLENGEKKLFTDKLNYNLATKVATYDTKSTMVSKDHQMTSKRGIYDVTNSTAYFYDKVGIVGPQLKMKTDSLKFNTNSNTAFFLAPTRIEQDSSKIYCEGGYYDLQNESAQFLNSPQFLKGDQLALADTMLYDGQLKLLTLRGNAHYKDKEKDAEANVIKYDRANEITILEGNAKYKDGKQEIVSENIVYNAKTKTYATKGRSHVSDPPQILEADQIDYENTGGGIAKGNVYWQDTAAKISITCIEAYYNKEKDYFKAYGGRPIMTTIVEDDTLFLRADTILSSKVIIQDTTYVSISDSINVVKDQSLKINKDSVSTKSRVEKKLKSSVDSSANKVIVPIIDTVKIDTVRMLNAYHKVRMYKKNFQAICDSLTYSELDSTFALFKAPVVWSDTSQFTADTTFIKLKEKKIDQVLLKSNAFIINSKDFIYFNQIKGRQCTATFDSSQIKKVLVVGNAESVYYTLDDANAYIGVNKTICSEMLMFFQNKKISSIKFFQKPVAKMTPMKQANHAELKLKGFIWNSKNRPKDKFDL